MKFNPKARTLLCYAIVLACTAAVFVRVLGFDFVSWDDLDLVITNPILHPASVEHLKQIWSGPCLGLYTPVPYTIWWLVSAISGGTDHPILFHAINFILHLCASSLVLSILMRCFRSTIAAVLGALIFSLHPLQVEPVVWVSGMNGVLAGALALVSMRLYLAFVDRRSPGRWGYYAAASLAFVLALLSKPTAVTAPLMIVLLDLLILRRPWRDLAGSMLPWIGAAAVFAAIAHQVQPASHMLAPPVWQRPAVAVDAIAHYLGKLFWPFHLTIDYARTPAWVLENHRWTVGLLALAIVGAFLFAARRYSKGIAIGLLIVVIALLPVLGFIPFDLQRFSTVADRYMYLAMFGAALALSWSLASANRRVFYFAGGLIACLLGSLSFVQAGFWKDTNRLAEHTLSLDTGSYAGNLIYGKAHSQRGDWYDAAACFRTALLRVPDESSLHYNLANALQEMSRDDDSISEYQLAIQGHDSRVWPRAAYNLGVLYMKMGRLDLAESQFKQVLQNDPENAAAQQNLRYLSPARVRFQ
ncbi:MAG: tetratricopeptide repeat protein [Planctomycetota bacterium]|nr:tetratricopeptide repeat protein [Planctomycetota bacterium]